MSFLDVWCLALGVGFGWFTCPPGGNMVWMTVLYRLYIRITGKIHKYVAILDNPVGYDNLHDVYDYKVSYAVYLRAYNEYQDQLLSEADKVVKQFFVLFAKIYWKFFVAGLLFGGILKLHMYLVGFVLYVTACYIQNYMQFVRFAEPMFTMRMMAIKMLDVYYEKHGLKKVKKRKKQVKVKSGA